MRLLAIDPGTTESAYVVLEYGEERLIPYMWGKIANHELRRMLRANDIRADFFVIEMIAGSYGKTVGAEVFETACWIGAFEECWYSADSQRNPPIRVFRKTAVTHITDNPKANDAAVRQALIDMWGGNTIALRKPRKCPSCNGKGRKSSTICDGCVGLGKIGDTGPLVGITADVWAALAIGVTACEKMLNL